LLRHLFLCLEQTPPSWSPSLFLHFIDIADLCYINPLGPSHLELSGRVFDASHKLPASLNHRSNDLLVLEMLTFRVGITPGHSPRRCGAYFTRSFRSFVAVDADVIWRPTVLAINAATSEAVFNRESPARNQLLGTLFVIAKLIEGALSVGEDDNLAERLAIIVSA
jgi:hypothetical protein